MTRQVITDSDNVLSIISCAQDYGHGNGVFMDFAWGLLDYECSDDEIEAHAKRILDDEAYGEEDYEDIKERLTELRDKYCKKVT